MIGSEEVVAGHLATAAREIARRHRVKFIPVWPRDVAACTRLAQRAGLPESSVTAPRVTHNQFHQEMQDTDFLFAFKLHAGILAAVSNVPFILIEYQPKCRDFMASAGWDQLCVPPGEVSPELLLHQVEQVESRGLQWREELCETMNKLAQRFEDYCAQLEPLLLK
jgi:polysaccharide pyruvyl transferase WcaK-like protein